MPALLRVAGRLFLSAVANVRLLRETDRELHFARPAGAAWLACAAAAICALAAGELAQAVARGLVLAVGCGLAIVGAGGVLWRHELTIDLLGGRYRGRRGFLPSPYRFEGSLDDLEGAVLHRAARRRHGPSRWVVCLELRTLDRPIGVFESKREREGRRELERLARSLKTAAIDRTDERETRRVFAELTRDRPEARAGRGLIAAPPPASGIDWAIDAGSTTIVLPAAVLRLGGGVRQVIREEAGALAFSTVAFGRVVRTRSVAKDEIDEICLQKEAPRPEIVVRSDHRVVRLGRDLDAAGQRWLCQTLIGLAGR
jgi:hypothetical protein